MLTWPRAGKGGRGLALGKSELHILRGTEVSGVRLVENTGLCKPEGPGSPAWPA